MDYLWTIFSTGWLVCSVIVILLMIQRSTNSTTTTVNVFSAEVNTYGDLLYTALMVALGPATLIIGTGGAIEKSMRKPLPWKKRNVNF